MRLLVPAIAALLVSIPAVASAETAEEEIAFWLNCANVSVAYEGGAKRFEDPSLKAEVAPFLAVEERVADRVQLLFNQVGEPAFRVVADRNREKAAADFDAIRSSADGPAKTREVFGQALSACTARAKALGGAA